MREGFGDLKFIQHCYGKEPLRLPMTPGTGLILRSCHFDTYARGSTSPYQVPLDWAAEQDDIDAFKKNQLYQHIIEMEVSEGVYSNWIRVLDEFPLTRNNPQLFKWKEQNLDTPASNEVKEKASE